MEIHQGKIMQIGFLRTSSHELRDIAKAWVLISIAFAIVMSNARFDWTFGVSLFLAAFSVGLGFLLHELAHKLVAQRYGAWAEFRSFDQMLLLALIMSFFGFVFAAPGAVFIGGRFDKRKTGIIAIAGPITNIALSILFLLLHAAVPAFWPLLMQYGFTINAWLAVFNMIPFGMFDGKKILNWDKKAYALTLIAGLALMFMGYVYF